MENEYPSAVADANIDQKKTSKKPALRAAMQIYKPPGLRFGGTGSPITDSQSENRVVHQSQTKINPSYSTEETAGIKPSPIIPTNQYQSFNNHYHHDNNNHRKSPSRVNEPRLNRTESSLSSESPISQKSLGDSSYGSHNNDFDRRRSGIFDKSPVKPARPTPPKNLPIQKEKPKKILSTKEFFEMAMTLRALEVPNNIAEMEQLIASEFRDESAAECVGNSVTQHAIEGGTNCCKQFTRICGLLAETPCFPGLIKGLHTSITQYFDCREKLRQEHFRMWITFLNYVSDIYANIGFTPNGEFVNIVFQVFEFLLRPPILDTLKIEELECLIGCLLSIGYDLERDCPDELSRLKDLIRDAFIQVHEPWARKMILLLLELGASGWKLPPEADEYYFLQSQLNFKEQP